MITIQDTIYMGTAAPASGGGGSGDAVWGSITGTLSNQTDLSDALATKQDVIDANNKLSASYVSGLATVATTGAYSDLSGTPTVDLSYDGTSTNAQSGLAVKSAIDATISSVYKAAGSVAFASLPTPSSVNEGYVYNVTDAFTTDSQFIEGSGKSYPAGTNVVVIDTGSSVYKFDVLTGMVDLSGYVPTSRTVNGKALTSNITLTASDVSALPDSTIIPTVNNATLTITQGGVSKGTFTANASSDVTIALDAGGSSVSYDNSTINENSSNELQAIGIKEVRTDTAIKLWHGTEQQWNQGNPITWYNWLSGNSELTWSDIDISSITTKALYSTVYANNKYTVGGDSGTLIESSDGSTWSSVNISSITTSRLNSIIYVNNKYIAVGASGTMIESSDGNTWTSINISSVTTKALYQIIYANNKYTAVGASGTIIESSDGSTWISVTSGVASHINSIVYANNKYIAVGANGTIIESSDGNTWSSVNISSITTKSLNSIVYANNKYTAVGLSGTIIESSDGTTWSSVNTSTSLSLWCIDYFNGKYIVVGGSSSSPGSRIILESSDGTNWTNSSITSTGGALRSIVYNNGTYITVGDKASILTASAGTVYSCYTTDYPATTASAVYSAPDVASTLTVTSVGTGTITLSDTRTYDYNSDGNQITYQSVGEAHPNYLCFTDSVGVKMGTTTIANNLAVAVDQTYNASSANAQSGVAIAGAGFLQNQATGSDALAIGENTANEISSTLAIGNNATVSNLSTAIAIGNRSSSSGGIAIGNNTHVGAFDVIIGDSVLSSAIPDRVGANPVFAVVDLYNSSDHAGFALVDLMTGKIPDNRLSSNIARTSDIPSVPTVNNPTITFKQGGTTKGTITLNQSSAQTITFDAGGGGGIVDQIYNAGSTNAQSGVAIAGAGFLRNQVSITSTIAIGNTNTTPNSILIGNNINITSGSSIDALGRFITVDTGSNNSHDVVIGSGCNVTGYDCVVVGQNITASTNKDILLGYNYNSSYIIDRTSTNPVLAVTNTASTDYEGFALVDLNTGKIPNARINGVSGSFTTNDGKTITVTNGVITNIS